MSQLSLDKFGENLPVSGVVALSQIAIGLGAGIAVADRMGPQTRRVTSIALVAAGIAALVPIVVGVASNLSNRPGSSREMQKRLASIRRDVSYRDTDSEGI